ncbi:hypothetical protein Q9L58_010509 [Maublancomyces gigas]|uniref:Uncharacterized protein n=1 Tax=Discina gigas TaxID=1032678 RepID=A0ABR3G3X0_9PEZI
MTRVRTETINIIKPPSEHVQLKLLWNVVALNMGGYPYVASSNVAKIMQHWLATSLTELTIDDFRGLVPTQIAGYAAALRSLHLTGFTDEDGRDLQPNDHTLQVIQSFTNLRQWMPSSLTSLDIEDIDAEEFDIPQMLDHLPHLQHLITFIDFGSLHHTVIRGILRRIMAHQLIGLSGSIIQAMLDAQEGDALRIAELQDQLPSDDDSDILLIKLPRVTCIQNFVLDNWDVVVQ